MLDTGNAVLLRFAVLRRWRRKSGRLFACMKGAPQQERLEASLKHQIASNRAQQNKINHDLEKSRSQLCRLQEEIGGALSGQSVYSPEDTRLLTAGL
jgi:hypothetical protein